MKTAKPRDTIEFIPGYRIIVCPRLKKACAIRRNRKLKGFKAVGMLAQFKPEDTDRLFREEIVKLAETDPRKAMRVTGKSYQAIYYLLKRHRAKHGLPMAGSLAQRNNGRKKSYTDEQLIECIKLAMLWMSQRKFVEREVRGRHGRILKMVVPDRTEPQIFKDAAAATGVTSWTHPYNLWNLHRGLPSNVLERMALRAKGAIPPVRKPKRSRHIAPSAASSQPAT